MRLSLTAAGRGGERHVVIGATPQTTVAEAAAWIAAALGEPAETRYYAGGRLLNPPSGLGQAGLRDGVVLGLGRPCAGHLDPHAAALIQVHAVSGSGAGLIFPLGLGSYRAGTGTLCTIRVPFGPEHAATVVVGPDGTIRVVLKDARLVRVVDPRRAEVGTYEELEVAPIDAASNTEDGGTIPWPADADLALGDTLLRWSLPAPPDGRAAPAGDGTVLVFERPPRAVDPIPELRFRMPVPPRRPQFGAAAVSAIDRLAAREAADRPSHRQAMADYRAARVLLSDEMTDAVRAERVRRLAACPDPAAVLLTAAGPGRRLWERRRADADHLVLRVGTGTGPSIAGIEVPRPEGLGTLRWPVPFVPVTVPLAEHGVLGLTGAAERIRPLASWLAGQIAVGHPPSEVRLVLLTTPDAAFAWDWARWLPHLRPATGSPWAMVGNDAETLARRVEELYTLVTRRQQARQAHVSGAEQEPADEPDVVVFIDGARLVREVPGLAHVLAEGPAVRVYAVCLEHEGGLLPPEASAVLADGRVGMTLRRRERPETADILADLVSPAWCDAVARALAPLRDTAPRKQEHEPSDHVPLLDLLALPDPDPATIAARWSNTPASTTVPIGADDGGALAVDLVHDGPHALIAGTSGPAKSEFLRSLIAALATVNRPDELTFFLIDHGDGSEYRECADLPHTVGLAADLDAQTGSRVLGALGAELRRRGRLLSEHRAEDFARYQSARRENPWLPALARLVIVVEEFSALADRMPDFIPGLVSVARRGRSLGTHLLLATRQPAGAITSTLRSDIELRIALRTATRKESLEVLDTEAAASLPPGRALVARLGRSSPTPFRTARSGAAYGESQHPGNWAVAVPWSELGRPLLGSTVSRMIENRTGTDLLVLVEALRRAAAQLAVEPQPRPWPPALPERIPVATLPPSPPAGSGGDLRPVPYGLQSSPGHPIGLCVALDLDALEHLYVVGAAKSGRTETLRTIAGSVAMHLTSSDVHIYALDAGGGALAEMTLR
jgi:S-DNA-T family DNA segregation ATPase FtsK/SpoIIIE